MKILKKEYKIIDLGTSLPILEDALFCYGGVQLRFFLKNCIAVTKYVLNKYWIFSCVLIILPCKTILQTEQMTQQLTALSALAEDLSSIPKLGSPAPKS